ncbi:MAG TPA: D-aminoacyl-tRNA deacylase [Actinomycetota bacterium]|nr:D-aminoacyl-tRNA deacylase [Actinomycetota bacterium]
MRVVLQRVRRASVAVDGAEVASIGLGYLLLVGVGHEDAEADADQLATKIVGLRIFRDADGKTNEDLAAVGGEALVVSQFTLFADTRKGRRPSFLGAAEPGRAAELVEHLAAQLEAAGVRVGRGVFGAEMTVDLLNDGPFTVLFDTRAS